MGTFLGYAPKVWQPDEISRAAGDPRHALNWSWDDLTELCLGPHTPGRVTVSRFYMLRQPRLVVDFEPAPTSRQKMFVDQKRRWAHKIGYVYVPIFLREQLTVEQLQHRIEMETTAMVASRDEAKEVAAVTYIPKGSVARPEFEDPEVREYIEQECLARVTSEEAVGRKYRGKARYDRLRYHRKIVEEEVRRRIADASLGLELSYRQHSVAHQ